MIKLIKITCLYRKGTANPIKGITESDVGIYDQYIDPCAVMAIYELTTEDRLPNAQTAIVTATGQLFTAEHLDELAERINIERERAFR